ncbi:hypothetical protein A9P82_06875 [Arachidicoccus ginsenosidimutans]|uniref:DNA polymerase III subunit n=1 Tax=Arachidicoccus sp. BS20 TaxID=1850526 RepID=UPI0007F0872B|nr:DNA polymerase III subunit delta' [Arachidicoccus sp. BS20]ANI89039.1 hypothetical protein A9P82_06875 [Arachidicoccus sp. BS20]
MQFKNVIGQQAIKTQLADMVGRNRISHALLFLGKEGVGALPLALAFAQYIVCENKQNGEVCGVCAPCIKASQYIHPDIHFSFPVIPKKSGDKPTSADYISEWREFLKNYPYGNAFDWLQSIGAENKQGNITAEECNDIMRKLSLKSYESEYKILIQWMPEYLGKEGNKLLKLIEEPPAKTLFIFVAENEEQILPTILSRTQLVKIPLLETKDIQLSLEQKANLSANKALDVANISEGNYRAALQLLQHASDDWQQYLRDWLNAILKGGHSAIVKWIEEMNKLGREKQKQFLRYFNHLLAQSLRLRIIGEQNVALSEQDKDFALRLNKIASVSQQEAIVEELDKAAYYIERNANAKMLFHALSIKLKYIIQHKTVILADS